MSTELIGFIIEIVLVLVICKLIFSIGKKILRLVFFIGLGLYLFVKYLWPIIENLLL